MSLKLPDRFTGVHVKCSLGLADDADAEEVMEDPRLRTSLRKAFAKIFNVAVDRIAILWLRLAGRRLAGSEQLRTRKLVGGVAVKGNPWLLAMQLTSTPMSTMEAAVGSQLSDVGIAGVVQLEEVTHEASGFETLANGTIVAVWVATTTTTTTTTTSTVEKPAAPMSANEPSGTTGGNVSTEIVGGAVGLPVPWFILAAMLLRWN